MVETGAVDSQKALEEMKAKGVTPCYWSEQEIAKARKIAEEVWEEWSKKSPHCQKVYAALKAYLTLIGRIK
jgi:TRAP-type mannitol/chloroaromatic compound transport system substrate-binding protein